MSFHLVLVLPFRRQFRKSTLQSTPLGGHLHRVAAAEVSICSALLLFFLLKLIFPTDAFVPRFC